MTTYRYLFAVLITCLYTAGIAHAQVIRCVDASGHVTYTDGKCPNSKEVQEILPPLSAQEQAQHDAQYQQALERKRAAQQLQAEREAAQQKANAERAAALAAQRPVPPVIVQVPPSDPVTTYVPLYPPRPPHIRPPPPIRPQPSTGNYNCNVFRCYDGKGNTWSRP